MITNCLLKRFDLIADAPGNIPRLRKLIVDLAVRGKLLRKTSEDASSEELLKRIAAKRDSLIKAGKLRKQRPLAPITAEELPAEYSAHCVFERLGSVAILEKGLTGIQSAQRGEYPLVVTAEARSTCDHFDFEGAAAIIPMVSSSGHGDASLKRLHYQEGKFALGNILCAAFPVSPDLISARFLYEYLTAFKEELLVSKMIGTANVSLTMGKIGDVPVPIVSPAIQQRVEELMGLCDSLESAQQEREAVRTRLRTSALHQLASPDSDSKSAAFILRNFLRFTAAPEDFASMRDAVRDSAVLGLFSADSSSWKRVQLGELTALVTSGSRGWAEFYSNSGALFVRAQNIKKNGRLMLDSVAYVDLPKNSEGTRTRIERDDLVVVITGAGVTQSARVQQDLDEAYVSQHVALIRLKDPACAPWISLQFLAKASARGQLEAQIYGGKPALNLTNIRELEIPLPPLAEQRRIVAKVDELMAVLDALETTLTTARTTAERLLAATIARLSQPEQPESRVLMAAEDAGPYGEAVKAPNLSANLALTRATLGAEIAHRMHGDRTFGQIKFQKAIYLAEYIAQLSQIDSHPERYQNGPHDPELIAQVEAKMKECEWFEAVPRAGGHGNEYHALAQAGGHQEHFEKLWPTKAAAIRKLIDEMKSWKTERCERFATLYAAWNDLIIWKKPADDTAILDQVLKHWHTAKQQIPKSSWQEMLNWMKREGYVPTGWGRETKAAPQTELSLSD